MSKDLKNSSRKTAASLLEQGQTIRIRVHGESMRGRIENGEFVALEPATIVDLCCGDVAFIKWKGHYLLHLVPKVESGRIPIGNNLGKVNGWVAADAIFGKVSAVEHGNLVSMGISSSD